MASLYDMSGHQLRKIAKAKGLSGKDLAEARGIRQETVSRHMNDRTSMNQEDYRAYAEILDVEATSLMARSLPTPLFGVVDRASVVHQRHASQVPLQISQPGPNPFGAASLAILHPKQKVSTATHDFCRLDIDDLQLDGMYLVHAASLGAKEIPHSCFSRLCLASVAIPDGHQWMLGYLYPEPENTDFDPLISSTFTIAPHLSGDSDLYKGMEVEAAAPILAKVYASELIGHEVFEANN
jgi:transcriptional regulator with XRE-family HTH domain